MGKVERPGEARRDHVGCLPVQGSNVNSHSRVRNALHSVHDGRLDDITDGSANNRNSMFPSGMGTPGDDGLYSHEDTQRRFFGAAASEGFFANRGSFASGSGASTPGLRSSYAGALYDSDGGSAVGLAPTAGAGTMSSADITGSARYQDVPYSPGSPARFNTNTTSGGDVGTPFLEEKVTGGQNDRALSSYADRAQAPRSRRRRLLIGGALVGLIILAIVIAVPVALTTKHHSSSDASTGTGDGGGGGGDNGGGGGGDGGGDNGGGNNGGGGQPTIAPTTGGDGSTVTTDKNTTFTYKNSFGGIWVEDPDDPFNMNAQAQSYVLPSFVMSPFLWRRSLNVLRFASLDGYPR